MRHIGTSLIPYKPHYIATVVKTQEKNWLQCPCQRDEVGYEDICSPVTKVCVCVCVCVCFVLVKIFTSWQSQKVKQEQFVANSLFSKKKNCQIILEKTLRHILSFLVWGQFCSPYVNSFLKTYCQLIAKCFSGCSLVMLH